MTACALMSFVEGPFGFFAPDETVDPEELTSPEGLVRADVERFTRTRLRYRPDAPLLAPTILTGDLDGVRAGSRWRIRGTAGRPEGTVTLLQCRAGAQNLGGCALHTRQNIHSHFEPRDRIGVSWEGRYRFSRHLHLSDGRQVDCAAVDCVLVAMDEGGDLDRSDRIATGFVT